MARPRKDAEGPGARERIVEAFWQLIACEPYSGITIRGLCAKARVNPNTFYRHFSCMDELAEKAFEENLVEGFPRLLLGLRGGAPAGHAPVGEVGAPLDLAPHDGGTAGHGHVGAPVGLSPHDNPAGNRPPVGAALDLAPHGGVATAHTAAGAPLSPDPHDGSTTVRALVGESLDLALHDGPATTRAPVGAPRDLTPHNGGTFARTSIGGTADLAPHDEVAAGRALVGETAAPPDQASPACEPALAGKPGPEPTDTPDAEYLARFRRMRLFAQNGSDYLRGILWRTWAQAWLAEAGKSFEELTREQRMELLMAAGAEMALAGLPESECGLDDFATILDRPLGQGILATLEGIAQG